MTSTHFHSITFRIRGEHGCDSKTSWTIKLPHDLTHLVMSQKNGYIAQFDPENIGIDH